MSVRTLRKDEHAHASQLLGRAFDDDPYFRWMLPREGHREKWIVWIMRTMIEQDAEFGTIFAHERDGSLAGVLTAIPPGKWPVSFGQYVRSVMRSGLFPPPTKRVLIDGLRAQSKMDKCHPPAEHWYVHALGVEPKVQRSGSGKALMQHVIDRANDARVVTYLETARPENLDYYRRFGFELTSELATNEGAPAMWTMTRPAP